MNRRQRKTIIDFTTIIGLTIAAVVLMFNVKDVINRSEAIRAMKGLGAAIEAYQQQYRDDYEQRHSKPYPDAKVPLPPSSFIDHVKAELTGRARFGEVRYRAMWIDLNAPEDAIVAYTRRDFHSWFVSGGYVVLLADGTVHWMEKEPFETLLASQQTPEERETILP